MSVNLVLWRSEVEICAVPVYVYLATRCPHLPISYLHTSTSRSSACAPTSTLVQASCAGQVLVVMLIAGFCNDCITTMAQVPPSLHSVFILRFVYPMPQVTAIRCRPRLTAGVCVCVCVWV